MAQQALAGGLVWLRYARINEAFWSARMDGQMREDKAVMQAGSCLRDSAELHDAGEPDCMRTQQHAS